MFQKILIANRGEIAVRIARTCRRLGIATVAVYSDVDRSAAHVLLADEAVALGGSSAAESYLRSDAVLSAARLTGAQAVHPGYGFLSENAAFAQACAGAGVAFIGPTPEQMRGFGLKHTARKLAKDSQVPLLPGSDLLSDAQAAVVAAAEIGYPVMLKSTAGGGGIGMRLCRSDDELRREFDTVRELGRNNFADDGIYLEKYVERARHVEVQIFGDGAGRVLALGDRDCSVQRRNQKVIEETPAPGIADDRRRELFAAAVRLGQAVDYRSAGTVEFVYDENADAFYFLEVNTRLQVEHGVTENVTGLDIVEGMLRLAAGETAFLDAFERAAPRGHSVQVRLYAEDPAKNFQPSTGLLDCVQLPQGDGVRVDAWIESGTEISPYYDPLLAKIMVTADSRDAALERLSLALDQTKLYGIETNLDYLRSVVRRGDFRDGRVWTKMLDDYRPEPLAGKIEVIVPGTQSSVQDYPGRRGYWDVGVPPSGPMDSLAFRIGNRLLGNDEGAPGLEMTVSGAALRFRSPAKIALTGARMRARLQVPDDAPDEALDVPYWSVVEVPAGSVLKLGLVEKDSGGCRTYLSIQGGFDVPEYLGSRSTFALGRFGGHAGRTLQAGDVLRYSLEESGKELANQSLPDASIPEYPVGRAWQIGVLYGPHGAPEFFTPEYIDTFFATDWEVHYNSARTGVRLIGPKPGWARPDGGEAGLHPSNIHDCAYAVGTVDFTGDMPIILGPDGPSLGGFVCPATIVRAELWKMGQLRPGDRVRFVRLSREEAEQQDERLETFLKDVAAPAATSLAYAHKNLSEHPDDAILFSIPPEEHPVGVICRQAGDQYLLIEYGEIVLELGLRFRVHALMQWLQEHAAEVPGIWNLTPGIRSLQIHYDNHTTNAARLSEVLKRAELELADVNHLEVPTRIVHLPLSWDDAATQLAVEKYMRSVWQEAPWCPDNIEFIRRINGLASVDAVKAIAFAASYLVLGLGDVYLGAPVATPVDPRHRLVTTKYNPARTWTPQNAVGIGGAYLCIYGMEGPGGYQFIGRTCQVWNTYRTTAHFEAGRPYLLRFFDQLRFFPVSTEELQEFRADFLAGRAELRIEHDTFRLSEYEAFLADNAASIAEFQQMRQAAFEAERERWKSLPPPKSGDDGEAAAAMPESELPAGCEAVAAPMHGTVWKVLVKAGDWVEIGQDVVILEAMKMEVSVPAGESGVVSEVLCAPGVKTAPGRNLLVIKVD